MPDTPISMRIPAPWLRTAEDLAEHYQETGEFEVFGHISRAKVLRLAIQEGLKAMKARATNQRKEHDQPN